MGSARAGLGRRGERLAAAALLQLGYRIVDRNWRCPEGEADLVALCGEEWYFIEVRTRRGEAQGSPEESLTPRKRARMAAVAGRYLSELAAPADPCWHLSLVAVALDRTGRPLRMTFYGDLEGERQELAFPEGEEAGWND
jgi:putative endonuclease